MEEAYQMNFTKTVESYESLNQGRKTRAVFVFPYEVRRTRKKSMGEKAIMQKTNEQIKKRLLNLLLWT